MNLGVATFLNFQRPSSNTVKKLIKDELQIQVYKKGG